MIDAAERTCWKSTTTNPFMGELLYSIEDNSRGCFSGEKLSLEFYENLLIVRTVHYFPMCGCIPELYHEEAIPRFKLVNVKFSNGAKSNKVWSLVLAVLALIMFSSASGPGNTAFIVFGVLLALAAIIPLFVFSTFRYLHFDVKNADMTKSSFFATGGPTGYSFRLGKKAPNIRFIVHYVFEPFLSTETTMPAHGLAHLTSCGLSHPLIPSLAPLSVPSTGGPSLRIGAGDETYHKEDVEGPPQFGEMLGANLVKNVVGDV